MPSQKLPLQLVILPGRNPSPEFRSYYDQAFTVWKNVWESAAKELEGFPATLYSNDFIRQDEILAVFYENECTSLGFWTELDMERKANQFDQYFQSWDQEALSQLTKDGTWIGKYSYFTVDSKYRSWDRSGGVSLTDLQAAIFCLRFLDSKCAAMTGTTRNGRKINQVCAKSGAQLIRQGLIQHGCEIDLMAWYRNTAKPYDEVVDLARHLWTKKIDYKQQRGTYVLRKGTDLTL